MKQLEQILREQAKQYRKMEPQDAVKLLYQGVFGVEHALKEPQQLLERLKNEWQEVAPKDGPLFEEIGGGLCRMSLAVAKHQGLTPDLVLRLFWGAAGQRGSKEEFEAALDLLRTLCRGRVFAFTLTALEHYLLDYRGRGCPPMSHSGSYRESYQPAYRLCLKADSHLVPLMQLIDRELAVKKQVVLAIDGPCGSGKSTLAKALCRLYDGALIAMDDFFLPPELRTAERFEKPGENVHYERFLAQVAPGLAGGKAFEYPAFDCSIMALGKMKQVPKKPLVIVEGSYSQIPRLEGLYDIKICTTCTKPVQLARLRQRGEELFTRFENEWIPLEEAYFSAFGILKNCHYSLDTTAIYL